jgi:hypothetical protein
MFNKSNLATISYSSVVSCTEFQNHSVTGTSVVCPDAVVVADERNFRNMTSGFSSMADHFVGFS